MEPTPSPWTIARRPLLIAAGVDHARSCAARLGLSHDGWDFLAGNSTFSVHRARLQVTDCDGCLTSSMRLLLVRLEIPIGDAMRLHPDGTLTPYSADDARQSVDGEGGESPPRCWA